MQMPKRVEPDYRCDPMMKEDHPDWYHHHGYKMRVEKLDLQDRILVLTASAAKVTIRRASSLFGFQDAIGWFVDWEVVQFRGFEVGTRGRAQFETEDLESAFGLSQLSGYAGQWLIEYYGGDAAEQRKYIRWKDFLNIPCPGTGHDGDPNVSILISDEIKDAVRKLLQ